MNFDYDFFVIGAGSGGVRAARVAASLGARVAIAEDLFLGGTCVNVGCVPKKLYVYAAEFAEEFDTALDFGWDKSEHKHDWAMLLNNKNNEIARLNEIYRKLLQDSGVDIVNGKASIKGPHKIAVAGQTYSAERILIAVGGWPRRPEFPGAEHALVSNDFFKINKAPRKVLVQGGGYVALEFAGIYNGLGSETELVYRGDLPLRGFDLGVRKFVCDEVIKKGITLSLNTDIKALTQIESELYRVELSNGETREVNAVMSAIGRLPKLQGLGIENTNIKLSASGHIDVNENFETHEPSIYAVGDVVGKKELTPVALAEGMALAKYLFAGEAICLDYSKIATAVFCQPNIATVGLGEEEAIALGKTIEVYQSSFRALKHSLGSSTGSHFMKLIVDKKSDKVMGCHMVGSHAGEIIQGIAIAITAGATKKHFDNTIGIHPTSAEEFVTMRTPRT